jgi:hypothetical protein
MQKKNHYQYNDDSDNYIQQTTNQKIDEADHVKRNILYYKKQQNKLIFLFD